MDTGSLKYRYSVLAASVLYHIHFKHRILKYTGMSSHHSTPALVRAKVVACIWFSFNFVLISTFFICVFNLKCMLLGLTLEEVESCIKWMAPFNSVAESKPSSSKSFMTIDREEWYTIQTREVSRKLLVSCVKPK